MWAYLVKRIFFIFVTLVGICMISFVLVTLAPGDPAAMVAGGGMGGGSKGGRARDEVLDYTRRALYLDRPVLVNFSPNTRERVARDLAKKICEGTDYARESAQETAKGSVGTAGLDVFIEEASARARKAEDETARLGKVLVALDAVAANQSATTAEVDAAVAPLEATFPNRGPRFSKAATPGERSQSWAAWGHDHAKEPASGVIALLDLLGRLVPASSGGPPPPTGTPVKRARVWSSWWEKNRERYSESAIATVVTTYMDAPADVTTAARNEVEKLGGAATATVMAELQKSSGERRQRAAMALSLVAHKPWDLTVRASDYEQEWDKRKKKIDLATLSAGVRETQLAELGSREAFVAKETARELKDQERSITRWWFRSEEEFVDFGVVRQIGRGLTQTQFGNWFRALAGGLDLGKSFAYKKDVSTLIAERLPVTLWLNFLSLLLTYLIAIPLGVFSATFPRTLIDRVTTIGLFILYSLPSFWVGAILILLFTGPPIGVSWFPSHGVEDLNSWQLGPWERLWDWAKHMTLPVICLTYGGIAYISRQMRGGMLEVVRQDYIRTARAKGLSEKVVIGKHAMRNSLIPIITILSYLLPSMFGGSVIIESIFSIDGLGKLMFDAILARDYPVIMSEVVITGLLTLLGVLIADISYAIVDPRIELK